MSNDKNKSVQCDECKDFYVPANRCYYCEHLDDDCTGICEENICTACCKQSFEELRYPMQGVN